MIPPFMKLNTTTVTTSQPPPHSISDARVRSVRGARLVNHSPATKAISAAGNSQEISVPIDSPPNIRVKPVEPPNIAPPIGPGPPSEFELPPGFPSPPNTRPRPL